MPELVLLPKHVFNEGLVPAHSPMIVGDPSTAWRDGSDDTWAWTDNSDSYVRADYPKWSDADGGDPTLDRTTVTGIAVRIRARSVPDAPDSFNRHIFIELDGSTSKVLARSVPPLILNPAEGWKDLEWLVGYDQWDTAGWAPDRIQSALDQLYIYPRIYCVDASGTLFSLSDHLQIAEQSVVLYYGEIPPPVGIVRRGIPLRQFPRDDGRQTASARRNFPPPKSYQSSNRRGGGYL